MVFPISIKWLEELPWPSGYELRLSLERSRVLILVKVIGGVTGKSHARTRIRSYGGSVSEWFGVNVGLHQGSVLSPLLFIIVMEAVTHSERGSTMGDAIC